MTTESSNPQLRAQDLTNYCAFIDSASHEQRIGHLAFDKQLIFPLSYASGTPLSNLYEVIEIGETNITCLEDPVALSDVKLLPPISGRDILAVGKNYADHAKEFNSSGFDASDKTDQPTQPVIFTKRATSIIAHGEEVLLHPGFTETVDYEGEIGVIVGKSGFKIPESEAMDYVWGYTIINDFTARERQRDHKQFYIGKSPDTYCPIGPIAVPKEHLPKNLQVQTMVNGEERQKATLDQLIFSIPRLISTLSMAQTLQIGDTLATGTPYGVGFGFQPMKFLKAGDEVKVTVTGLGSLVNRVASADAPNPTIQSVNSKSYVPVANSRTRAGVGLVQLGSKRLFYQSRGQKDGQPAVFIHGLGGSSSYFEPLFSSLAATHCLHLSDLEGHGLSPTSALSALSISSFASDVKQICQTEVGGKPAIVIAHSMGCLVALKFAIENPSLVSKLILMGPPPNPLPQAGSTGATARAATVRKKGMLGVADAVVEAGLSPHTKETKALAVAATRISLLGQDPEGYAKACMALAGSKDDPMDVSSISAQSLIITGSHDGVCPPKVAQGYASQMKACESQVLQDVGHWHIFEDPDGVRTAILKFLQ